MFWSFVYAWIVVMKPDSIPARSSITLASGATQFVVHEAFETMWCVSGSYVAVVDAEDERDVRVGRGGRDEDLLRAGVEVLLCALAAGEEPGRLEHDVDAEVAPRKPGGVSLREHLHRLTARLDDPVAERDVACERAEHRVVLQEVGHRLRVAEVVERDDLDVGAQLLLRAEEVAADPAEAVDADPGCHALLASVCVEWVPAESMRRRSASVSDARRRPVGQRVLGDALRGLERGEATFARRGEDLPQGLRDALDALEDGRLVVAAREELRRDVDDAAGVDDVVRRVEDPRSSSRSESRASSRS